jgi:hypothetical protein
MGIQGNRGKLGPDPAKMFRRMARNDFPGGINIRDFVMGGVSMKRLHFIWATILGLLVAAGGSPLSWPAQQSAPGTVPVSTVVSVEAKHGKDIPVVSREDVRVLKGKNQLRVTDWVPLQGNQSGLELFVLIDDASSMSVASQLEDMRRFMNAQPSTTAIAVGYMQNGTVRMVQNFTKDHSQAGKALRMPLGSGAGGAGPYLSITDAIKRWPASNASHEIILISDGTDPLQPGPMDSYLDQAVEQAQRTGTQIYAIYASHAGHFGHTLWRISQGQNNLSQLTDETGGEAYFQGFETPIAFAPFLDQIADRLNHQYKLTFLAIPDKKPSYQHAKLETELPNAELVTADKVYVPAAK